MKNSKQVSVNLGENFLIFLGLLFIALKLTGNITWSWWWVLLPLYGPVVFFLAIAGLVGLAYLIERR